MPRDLAFSYRLIGYISKALKCFMGSHLHQKFICLFQNDSPVFVFEFHQMLFIFENLPTEINPSTVFHLETSVICVPTKFAEGTQNNFNASILSSCNSCNVDVS